MSFLLRRTDGELGTEQPPPSSKANVHRSTRDHLPTVIRVQDEYWEDYKDTDPPENPREKKIE